MFAPSWFAISVFTFMCFRANENAIVYADLAALTAMLLFVKMSACLRYYVAAQFAFTSRTKPTGVSNMINGHTVQHDTVLAT
jgi:hypothetical protein